MNKLVMAMGEIGDDLILSALESVQTSSPQRGRTGGRAAVYRPARRQHSGVRVRVTALAVGAHRLGSRRADGKPRRRSARARGTEDLFRFL